MALLIPPNIHMDWQGKTISIQSFILALTVGSIMFTTFIKATSIIPLIKRLHIDKLSLIDSITYIESKILFLLGIVERIELI
jgi:NhaP-type Na+/H+ or K+/H+ antiporter